MNLKNENKAPYQSAEWANAKKASGKEPILVEERGCHLIAFEQVLKTPLGKKKILVSEGTPEYGAEDMFNLLEKFKGESKKYFYGTIFPTVTNTQPGVFEKAGFRKVSNYTILIDLKKSEDELFKNLEKKSARWGVKTAEKNNLLFRQANAEDIEEFYSLYKHTAHTGHFEAEKPEFLKSLADTGISKLFVIKHDEKTVAGGLILIDSANNYSVLNLTGSNEEGQHLQAMPFLYWNLIKFSKSQGLGYFDLGGYDKEAKQGDKTYNINKFKENFGGQVTEQPIYSTNRKYPFFRSLMKKAKFIKKMYRKEK